MNSATEINVVDVPMIVSKESNESNLLELIEQKFRVLLQCNKDLVLLSPNNSRLNAYRFSNHQDVELLKETLEKSKHPAFITMKDAGDRIKLDVTDNGLIYS